MRKEKQMPRRGTPDIKKVWCRGEEKKGEVISGESVDRKQRGGGNN